MSPPEERAKTRKKPIVTREEEGVERGVGSPQIVSGKKGGSRVNLPSWGVALRGSTLRRGGKNAESGER